MFDALTNLPPGQRWQQQTFPAPIVVALIRRQAAGQEPKYLLIQRNTATYRGQWALVGGKWDFGETLPTAVTREVQEETGLSAQFVALCGIVSERVAPAEEGFPGAHFLLLVCELAAPDGLAEEQQEGAVAWFTPAEIRQLHRQQGIIPSDYAMIQRFARPTAVAEASIHIEAEMVSAIGGAGYPTELRRFEEVNGRLPSA